MLEILMRGFAFSLLIGASLVATGAAHAQDRGLVLKVKPRSFLDAGTEVQVGSMQNYVYDQAGSRDIARYGAQGSGTGFLPARPGQGIAFYSPQWWSVR